ncbi:hypothetical protein D3C72_2499620 [compost metagenome]
MLISAWLSGANRNMPAEPAAVPMPKAMERCSGVTCRAKAERMTLNEPAPIAMPTSTPPPICSQMGASAWAISRRPVA